MKIGEVIRYHRKRANLTQLQLAESIGVDRSTIARYENGSNNPSASVVEKISAVVGVNLFEKMDFYTEHDMNPDSNPLDKVMDYFIATVSSRNEYMIVLSDDSNDMSDNDGYTVFTKAAWAKWSPYMYQLEGEHVQDTIRVSNIDLKAFWNRLLEHADIEIKALFETYTHNGK